MAREDDELIGWLAFQREATKKIMDLADDAEGALDLVTHMDVPEKRRRMTVMPSNNTKWQVHYWQGAYGSLGHLYGPGGQRGPYPHLPYALDNGAFPCWEKGDDWDEGAFLELLDWSAEAPMQPLWVATPDVVTDAKATLKLWPTWSKSIRDRELRAALVVQDGMTPEDAKACEPDLVFIGGSTDWKWGNLWRFCELDIPVHVGRVNGYWLLVRCFNAGAVSCDGTGWFRGDPKQIAGLERFLRQQAAGNVPHDAPLFA